MLSEDKIVILKSNIRTHEELIEFLNNKYENLQKELKDIKKYKYSPKVPFIPSTLIALTIGSYIGLNIMPEWISSMNPEYLSQIMETELFGQIILKNWYENIYLAGITFFFLPISILVNAADHNNYKSGKKEYNSVAVRLEYLEDQIKKEKQNLEDEKLTLSRNIDSYRVVACRKSDKIKEFEEYLKLYANLGYHYKRYYRLYKKNKLDKAFLNDEHKDEFITVSNEFIEENGKELIRKI